MITLSDNFNRANQSGLGTSTQGITYSVGNGGATTDISANTGEIVSSPLNSICYIILNNVNAYSIKFSLVFIISSAKFGVVFRATGNTYYAAFLDDATGMLHLEVHSNGSVKDLATPVSVLNYVTNTATQMIVTCNNFDISVECFPLNAPLSNIVPIINVTDNTILQSGSVGFYSNNNTASTSKITLYNLLYTYQVGSLPTIPPNGWQESIVSLDATLGTPFDNRQLDPSVFYASINALIRGLLYYISDIDAAILQIANTVGVVSRDWINYQISLGNGFSVNRRQSPAGVGQYPMALFNPNGGTKKIIVYSIQTTINKLVGQCDVFSIAVDPGYANAPVPQNMLVLSAIGSVAHVTQSSASVAFPADSARVANSYTQFETLLNEKVTVLQPNVGISVFSTSAGGIEISQRIDWIEL